MKKKKDSSFAKKTKIALAEKGETQASIARKMGVTRAQINLWLRGNRIPKMDSLQKLADALGKPVNYFFDDAGQGSYSYFNGNYANNNSNLTVAENGSDYRLVAIERELEILKKDMQLFKLEIEKKLAEENKK